jgi:hypothetical protein
MYNLDASVDRLDPHRSAGPSINRAEKERPGSSDPIQLELFECLVGGTSWVLETPFAQVPSREFCLPPSGASAPSKTPRPSPPGCPARTSDEVEGGNP